MKTELRIKVWKDGTLWRYRVYGPQFCEVGLRASWREALNTGIDKIRYIEATRAECSARAELLRAQDRKRTWTALH